MPFVASVHLNEFALASLHKAIHNDSSSNFNLCRPLYILTTIEDTLSLRPYSLYSISCVLKYSQSETSNTTETIDKLSFNKLLFVKCIMYTTQQSPLIHLFISSSHVRHFLLNCESVSTVEVILAFSSPSLRKCAPLSNRLLILISRTLFLSISLSHFCWLVNESASK